MTQTLPEPIELALTLLRQKEGIQVQVPCPDGMPGCLVAHYKIGMGPIEKAIREALNHPDVAVVPKTATAELLVSMAIRYDHALAIPGYYDQPLLRKDGDPTHQQRMESAIITMKQLHEEVVGTGFYKP